MSGASEHREGAATTPSRAPDVRRSPAKRSTTQVRTRRAAEPANLHARAAGFAEAVVRGWMSYSDVMSLLIRAALNTHLLHDIDGAGRRLSQTLCAEVECIESRAANSIRQWALPLALAGAPGSVVFAAALAANKDRLPRHTVRAIVIEAIGERRIRGTPNA